MWLPEDPTKFSAQFKYIELAHYVEKINSVIRDPGVFEWKDVQEYRAKYRNSGIYTSVFHYNSTNLEQASRLGSLYFDLDSTDGTNAYVDAKLLTDYLLQVTDPNAVKVFFTGAKGFHIEVEAMALGVTPNPILADVFRHIAKEISAELHLETVDFQVYDQRRMWRLENSQHQKSGLYKVLLPLEYLGPNIELDSIKECAEHIHPTVPLPQVFSAKANEWYRKWQYQHEVQATNHNDRIKQFLEFGTTIVVKGDFNDLEFDPVTLFENCPAIAKLWTQAEQEHDLSHEARLFLCSILTYEPRAEEYLHKILAQCDDYSPDRTQSHIDDWKRRRALNIGGRPFTCSKVNELGIGCGHCELEPKERWVQVGEHLVKSGELASPSPIRYAYKRKKR